MNHLALLMGGIIGGLLRYGVEVLTPSSLHFPFSTILINLGGALAIGLFYRFADQIPLKSWLRLGFGTGLIGAFTTFSTLCMETANLLQSNVFLAIVYGVLSLTGGPVCVVLGESIPALFSRVISGQSHAVEERL